MKERVKALYKDVANPKVFYQQIFRRWRKMIAGNDTKFLPYRLALESNLMNNYQMLLNLFRSSQTIYNYSNEEDFERI